MLNVLLKRAEQVAERRRSQAEKCSQLDTKIDIERAQFDEILL